MYIRVTSFKAEPAKLEEAIGDLRDRVIPSLAQAPGFLGATALAKREDGSGAASTVWESLEAMNSAEQAAQQARTSSAQRTGVDVLDVDRFEITLLETPNGAPALPSYSRIITGYEDLSRAEEANAFLRDEILPVLKAQPGFRSFSAGINRMTGRGFTVSSWDSAEHREASNAAIAHLRQRVMETASLYGAQTDLAELVIAELKLPTTA